MGSAMAEVQLILPGIPYGTCGELIANCSDVESMLRLMVSEGLAVKLPAKITDDDKCQRDQDGEPLQRFHPGVEFFTRAEKLANIS